MADRMRMDFPLANECKTGLKNGADELQAAIKNLDSVIGKLEQAWEGDSSRKFCEEYNNNLRKALETVRTAVEETGNALNRDINKWSALDQRG